MPSTACSSRSPGGGTASSRVMALTLPHRAGSAPADSPAGRVRRRTSPDRGRRRRPAPPWQRGSGWTQSTCPAPAGALPAAAGRRGGRGRASGPTRPARAAPAGRGARRRRPGPHARRDAGRLLPARPRLARSGTSTPQAERLMGRPRDEVLGRTLWPRPSRRPIGSVFEDGVPDRDALRRAGQLRGRVARAGRRRAGSRCAPGRSPAASRSTSSTSPTGVRAEEAARRADGAHGAARLGDGGAVRRPGRRVRARPAGAARRARRSPTAASSPWSTARAARGTSAPGTPTRGGAHCWSGTPRSGWTRCRCASPVARALHAGTSVTEVGDRGAGPHAAAARPAACCRRWARSRRWCCRCPPRSGRSASSPCTRTRAGTCADDDLETAAAGGRPGRRGRSSACTGRASRPQLAEALQRSLLTDPPEIEDADGRRPVRAGRRGRPGGRRLVRRVPAARRRRPWW